MKRFAYAIMIFSVAAASCSHNPKSKVQKELENYELIEIPAPDLSGISDNGKEVLNLYRFAADEADAIYWKQYFGDKTLMTGIQDNATKEYAMVNYGPWDRISGKSFIKGYGVRPLGANFYPADMTQEEFDALANPAKSSPYTVIRRDENGKLKAIWFHQEYEDEIAKISSYLKAAADITIVPSVREYLLKKIEALRTDNYYESDLAWLDMTDSKMDLVIGPNENADDQLYGLKNSYEAFVLLKNLPLTEKLARYTALLPEFQAILPCEEQYKTFTPGTESDIYAYNALYYAGNANAGIKVIAINLPFDPKVQADKGTRTALMSNIMEQKFNRIVYPTGIVLFDSDQTAHLNPDAFFWNIACREIAHGLGVKETVNGKGSVTEALGNKALTIEEAKGSIIGLYLSCYIIDKHEVSALLTKKDAITTYIASLVRSERFGSGEALGRSNIIIYNYLVESGAILRQESGKYHIDYDKAYKAVSDLGGLLLKIQATGDYEAAAELEKTYGKVSGAYKADIVNLRLENIPVDLRFTFKK